VRELTGSERRRRPEGGTTIVLFALTAVVLMVFVAFAVDLGGVANERRQDQTTGDAAALGAAQKMPSDVATLAAAMALVRNNLGLGAAELPDSAFNTCGAYPARPVVLRDAAGNPYNCVSTDRARSVLRVVVPPRAYATTFARVIGITSLRHSATADAEVKVRGYGGILPFAITVTSGTGCLKDGPGNKLPDPCNGPDTGNFGTIRSPLIGSDALGTSPGSCPGAPTNHDLENNIAVGLDHRVVRWTGGPDYTDTCAQAPPAPTPNSIEVKTGFTAGVFENGMIAGTGYSDGLPARLQRGPFPKRPVLGANLDNWPLYAFIPPGLAPPAIPASCRRSSFSGDGLAQMRVCLADYANPPPGVVYQPLFALDTDPGDGIWDIQRSPRFAYVPLVSDLPNGSSESRRILGFVPVFLQTLWAGCNKGACDVAFNPDGTSTTPLSTNKQINGMSVLALSGTLPGALNDDPYRLDANVFIQLVR
jgi:Flp pilus assembly protein TadG